MSTAHAQIITYRSQPQCDIKAQTQSNFELYFEPGDMLTGQARDVLTPYMSADALAYYDGMIGLISKVMVRRALKPSNHRNLRRNLRASFTTVCKNASGMTRRELRTQFKAGFSKGSFGEQLVFASVGHKLLNEESRPDLAAPFLKAAGEIVPLHLYLYRPPFDEDDDEVHEDSQGFVYRLLDDRAKLALISKDISSVHTYGEKYWETILAHKAFDGTESSVTLGEYSLSIIDSLYAVGSYPLAYKIFQSEFASSFESFGSHSMYGSNGDRETYTYDMLVLNSAEIHDTKAFEERQLYESLILNYPPYTWKTEENLQKIISHSQSRVKILSGKLPENHPVFVREKFYGEVFEAAKDAILDYPDRHSPYIYDYQPLTSQIGLENFMTVLARWEASYKSMSTIGPADKAMRLYAIYTLQSWGHYIMPNLCEAPEQLLEYILDNYKTDLHPYRVAEIQDELGKAYVKRRPINSRRFDPTFSRGKNDPLRPVLSVYRKAGEYRSELELRKLNMRRAEFLPRLANFKAARPLLDAGFRGLRPSMKHKPQGEYYDPYQLMAVVRWLETGDIDGLLKVFPPIEPSWEPLTDEIVISGGE